MKKNEKAFILTTIFTHLPPDDCIVFLFGSRATGSSLRGSDIDVGVLAHEEISPSAFATISEVLENNSPTLTKIDIVDFATVDEKVKSEALKEIELWHVGKNCDDLLKILKTVSKN